MSVRKTVTSTTFSSELPASSRIALTFSMHARVCASMPSGIFSVSRSRGPIPERKSKFPTRRACGYGPRGRGAREDTTAGFLSEGFTPHILREGRHGVEGAEFPAVDRRAPALAQAASGQQAGLRGRRFHRHGRRRAEQPQGLPHRRRTRVLLPARRRDGLENDPGWERRGRPYSCRRDLPPAGASPPFTSANAEFRGPRHRKEASPKRKGRAPVVLRQVHVLAIRRVLHSPQRRKGFSAHFRSVLRRREKAYLQEVRHGDA